MFSVTDKIKNSIHDLIHNKYESDAEAIYFYLDEHLGLIDEEYNQCLFPEDGFGGIIYDSVAYLKIEAAIMSEINQQLNETSK